MSHTNGPWNFCLTRNDDTMATHTNSLPAQISVFASTGDLPHIATVRYGDHYGYVSFEEAKDNAMLMAEAPNLLDTVKELLQLIDDGDRGRLSDVFTNSEAVNKARNILKKLTGEN